MPGLQILDRIVDLYEESANAGEPRASFKCLDFRGQRVESANLVCSDWVECDLRSCVFVNCDLRGSSFVDSELRNVKFEGCSMYACELPQDASIECVDCSNIL